jgi:hypothetical protein
MGDSSAPFDLVGDRRGFRLFGSGYQGGLAVNQFAFCDGEICNSGDAVDFLHAAGGLDLVASATLDGVSYPEVGLLDGPSAGIGFSSSAVLLPDGAGIFRMPFTMEGSFNADGKLETLTGSGIVTTRWTPIVDPEAGANAWDLVFARYEFAGASAAVPEPATMLLTGMAAAVAAFKTRRRSAAASGDCSH